MSGAPPSPIGGAGAQPSAELPAGAQAAPHGSPMATDPAIRTQAQVWAQAFAPVATAALQQLLPQLPSIVATKKQPTRVKVPALDT